MTNLAPPSNDELMGRVMAKVVVTPSGCWEYQGARHVNTRHGIFGYTVQGKGTTLRVHRWVYENTVGPVDEGLVLDHLCRNPPCCNPSHLEPVPPGVNVLRGESPGARNARKTKCHKGHEFTGSNFSVDNLGRRVCLLCKREREARYRSQRRSVPRE